MPEMRFVARIEGQCLSSIKRETNERLLCVKDNAFVQQVWVRGIQIEAARIFQPYIQSVAPSAKTQICELLPFDPPVRTFGIRNDSIQSRTGGNTRKTYLILDGHCVRVNRLLARHTL